MKKKTLQKDWWNYWKQELVKVKNVINKEENVVKFKYGEPAILKTSEDGFYDGEECIIKTYQRYYLNEEDFKKDLRKYKYTITLSDELKLFGILEEQLEKTGLF